MSKGKSVAAGFVAAAVIGGGGGYALGPIADSMAAHFEAPPLAGFEVAQLQIEETIGDVKVLGGDGGWSPAKAGDSASRPTCVEASGVLSTMRGRFGSIQISLGHDARVVFGENDSAIQLDRGQVKVSGGRVSTYVPHHRMKVSGTNYGLWSDDERVVLAVVEGEVEVTHQGESSKFAGGRQIVFGSKNPTPHGIEPQLSIHVSDEQKKKDERKISGNVPGGTFLFRKTDGGYERVSVSSSGRFSVTLPGKEGTAGELIAFDAAGRNANLGGTPDAVKAALEPEKDEAGDEESPPPPPAEKKEKKEKKEKEKEKKAPKLEKPDKSEKKPVKKRPTPDPLEKPEATPPRLEGDDVPVLEETGDDPEEEADEQPPTLIPLGDDDEEKVE